MFNRREPVKKGEDVRLTGALKTFDGGMLGHAAAGVFCLFGKPINDFTRFHEAPSRPEGFFDKFGIGAQAFEDFFLLLEPRNLDCEPLPTNRLHHFQLFVFSPRVGEQHRRTHANPHKQDDIQAGYGLTRIHELLRHQR